MHRGSRRGFCRPDISADAPSSGVRRGKYFWGEILEALRVLAVFERLVLLILRVLAVSRGSDSEHCNYFGLRYRGYSEYSQYIKGFCATGTATAGSVSAVGTSVARTARIAVLNTQ